MKEAHYKLLLDKKLKQSRYKQLKCVLPIDEMHMENTEKPILNFSSGDFLGLSNHPFVKKNTIKYVLKWGAGSSASRLVTSHLDRQHELEKKLASLLNKESLFFLNPTQNIHELLLLPLGVEDTIFFIDEDVSNLIKTAANRSKARTVFFAHNNIEHLKAQMEMHQDPSLVKWIVTESIFHTTGDFAPIPKLIKLAQKENALTYVDDSLSFSLHGQNGFGIAAPKQGIDLTLSGFSRTCGAFGNFVATSHILKEFLMHFCVEIPSVTLLPPAALGAIDASIDLIPDMHEERKRISSLSLLLRQSFLNCDLDIGSSASHIFPIQLSNEKDLFNFFSFLVNENIVAQNLKTAGMTAKYIVRLVVNATHTKEQIRALENRILTWSPRPHYEAAFT